MPLPLAGRRVVVTRTPEQAGELIAYLEAAGATALALPTIAIGPPADLAPLDTALRGLAGYDGFIFTSVNAVQACFARARELGVAAPPPEDAWVCAVGQATAAALAAEGWKAGILPAVNRAEGVVAALAGRPLAGRRIFFPRAAEGRELIPAALGEAGARLELVEVYQTQLAESSRGRARELFPAAGPAGADTVVFTSSSTARNLTRLLGDDYRTRLRGVTLAAIGPVTRATLEELGLAVAVEAPRATVADLAAALVAHARTARG